MDDLLNKTRYNNLIRPAASSSQLISIQLQLSLAQLISVVGAGSGHVGRQCPVLGKGRPFGSKVGSWEALPRLVDKVPDGPSDLLPVHTLRVQGTAEGTALRHERTPWVLYPERRWVTWAIHLLKLTKPYA